jgi:hypothetical protein
MSATNVESEPDIPKDANDWRRGAKFAVYILLRALVVAVAIGFGLLVAFVIAVEKRWIEFDC